MKIQTMWVTMVALALSSQGQAAGTLVYGASGEPVSMEPGNITDGNSIYAQRQIYDYLVEFKDGTVEKRPGLATSWSANANSTEWTFKLRQGVKFHDGTPFNADAVIFNINRWWDPKDPYGFRDQGRTFEIWGDQFSGFKGDKNGAMKSIEKLNSYTVKITLTKPNTVLPDIFAGGYYGIASPTAIKKLGSKYGTPAGGAVGTGPFVFDAWQTGQQVSFKANTKYWDKSRMSKVDAVVFRITKDANARLTALKTGQIDFASDLSPSDYKSLQGDQSLRVVLKPSFNVGFLSMNYKNQYLKNDKVRQAISMAINKKAIVDGFWNGLGTSNASFLPPVLSWANNPNLPEDYTYDTQKAKDLLKEAGYPSGFTLQLWYMPVSRPYFPNPKPIAEAIAADLSGIGIKVSLQTEDWGKYLEDRNKEPGFDMYMMGWTGDYGDPDNFYSAYYGPLSSDDSNYQPQILNDLLAKGREVKTQKEKAAIYAQIHEITFKANVRIPMVHSRPLAAIRPYVKGWFPSPLGTESFNMISIDGK